MYPIADRDELIRRCWINTKHMVPPEDPRGPHFAVTVLGVIDDPRFRIPGADGPFVDFVSWWPASRMWTVTHQCRADELATDCPCTVTFWQQQPPLPWF